MNVYVLIFQAIKCELVGLNPLNGERSDEVVDLLYEMTKTIVDDESIFKPLSLIVSIFFFYSKFLDPYLLYIQ